MSIAALWAANRSAVAAKDYATALKIWRARLEREPASPANDAPGLVSIFGARRVYGWLHDLSEGDEVELRLNGRVIYRTAAVQLRELDGRLRAHVFRFTLSALWNVLGVGDRIEVTLPTGRPLTIRGFGNALRPWLKRASKVPALFAKLDAGYAFNKWGKLQKPLDVDTAYTGTVMALFDAAADVIERDTGRRPFVFYGTLLGAIRSGEFIAHDDDIDVLWLSDKQVAEAVRADFVAVCQRLLDSGFELTIKPFGVKVRYPGTRQKQSFGLHYGCIDAAGALRIAYGHHGPLYYPPGGDITMTTAALGRFTVPVPVDSAAILEMLYTAGWKVPDPGFSHHNGERQIDTRLHLDATERAAAGRTSDPVVHRLQA